MKKRTILIIGSGGREHAVGWKVAQSPHAKKIYFAPGNAGTALLGENIAIPASDIHGLLDFAKRMHIDLTLALPDDPLALGIVDLFHAAGLRIFGPSMAASKLESSKAFAKRFMSQHHLPTAGYQVFRDIASAKKYTRTHSVPMVIKASGLALGKGVVIAQSVKEAHKVLEDILVHKIFGDAGSEVVIEEFISGPEISVHAFSDGVTFKLFPFSQDHKRALDNDSGPNTGGMGTVTPLSFIDKKLAKDIELKIVSPTLQGMRNMGTPYVGVLFPGLIVSSSGPKILEYNARFGDPETQVYMRLLKTDLLDIVDACIDEKLSEIEIEWSNKACCNVVLASGGYPNAYKKGKVITGISDAESDKNIVVFHAGTMRQGDNLVTNGGRVLGLSVVANTLKSALETAYEGVRKISFDGMQYRMDIGQKALVAQTVKSEK